MDVLASSDADTQEIDRDVMESTALLSEGIEGSYDDTAVRAAKVTFRPGERTKFHTHDGIQILYVTEGEGIVANREERRRISEGDLVLFSAGEEHWHGNTDDADRPFSHIYFLSEPEEGNLTVLDAPD